MATNGTHAEPIHLTSSTLPSHHTTHPTPTPTSPPTYQLSTLSVHADDPLNTRLTDVAPPIHVSTTFRYTPDATLLRPFRASDRPELPTFPHTAESEHVYSRLNSHTLSRFEKILTALLHGPAISYSSGLSAINAWLVFANPSVISIGAGYHGSHGVIELHKRLKPHLKVVPLECDAEELGQGDVIMLETPVNPTGEAFDIAHFARKAHSRGAYLFVDSTFAPPPLQDPFIWGADVVMHSGTKYFGGHSDMLCGVLAVNVDEGQGFEKRAEWLPQLLEDREFLGSVVGGLEGWLGVRSLRTLELRVERQSRNAGGIVKKLSGALQDKPPADLGLSSDECILIRKVLKKVYHASLQLEDPKNKVWLSKQMPNGFGPVFSIELKSEELARHFPSKLALFHHATSLGGVESLIEWRTMSDATVSRDLLRVSIGVEDEGDLMRDILQAFGALVGEFKL